MSSAESFEPGCSGVELLSGITSALTSRHICLSNASASRWLYFPHSDKFTFSRPSLTWSMTNHDTGATCEYHGQRVLFEWQSLHERSRIAATGGVTWSLASIAWVGSLGGLLFAGPKKCAITMPQTTTTKTQRNTRSSFFILSESFPANL